MAEYSSESLIDISQQEFTVILGTVVRSNNNIVLSANSSCVFNLRYGTDENIMKANSLRVKYACDDNNEHLVTRYNALLKVNLQIQYYKEGQQDNSYIAGAYESVQIYPYLIEETDGYLNQADININSELIKQLDIYITNTSEVELVVYELNIFREKGDIEIFNETQQESTMLYGTMIEPRTDDPVNPEVGRIWLRTDLEIQGD